MEQSFLDEEFISEEDLVEEALPKKNEAKTASGISSALSGSSDISPEKKSSMRKSAEKSAIKITPVKAEKMEKKEEKKEPRAEKRVQVHEIRQEPKPKVAPPKLDQKQESSFSVVKESLPKKEPLPKEAAKESGKATASSAISSAPVNPWATENGSGTLKSVSTWKAMTGIVLILLLFSVVTDGFQFGGEETSSEKVVLSQEEATQKVLSFVNAKLLQPPFVAEVRDSAEMGDLYKVTLAVAGQEVDSYVTKDGELFFPQGIVLSAPAFSDTADEPESSDAPNSKDNTEAASPEGEGPATGSSDPDGELTGAAVTSGGTTAAEERGVDLEGEPFLGDATAPVTVVEFSDYQCSFCRKFWAETLPQLKDGYIITGKVKFFFKDFPLNSHPEAQPAALAAACAQEQGKFWEYHDKLFDGQRSLGDEQYAAWAEELGLDGDRFASCLSSKKYQEDIQADIREAAALGILGTPAFVINGKVISGFQPYSVFVREVDAALAAGAPVQDTQRAEEPASEEQAAPEEAPAATETSGTDSGTESGDDVQDVILASITAKKWLFGPNKLTVGKGDEVQLSIMPESDFTFTFSLPAFGVEKEVSGATRVSFVADKAGEFPFSCSSCEAWRGMTGKIVVK